MRGNQYSATWFRLFLETIPPERTAAEVAFLREVLPLPGFRRVLDCCCGAGRHARILAAEGYQVLGIDTDAGVLEQARCKAPQGAAFRRLDMRELGSLDQEFDAAVILWQSFGNFDDATNLAVLQGLRDGLREGGRLVLDLYNRSCSEPFPEQRLFRRGGVEVKETRVVRGPRLQVRLSYADQAAEDRIEWRLYHLEEITALAEAAGMRLLRAAADFALEVPPSPQRRSMQLVFERTSGTHGVEGG